MTSEKERLEFDEEWDEDDDSHKDKYLTFHLGGEDYGLEIAYVEEIVGVQKITEVPDMPAFIRGVINLRGQVIPVMDMRLRFNMERRDYDERTCVIVVQVRETSLGLIVDTVNEVRDITADNISPPPQVAKSGKSRFILGLGKVGEEVKILLDVEKILFEEELASIEAIG